MEELEWLDYRAPRMVTHLGERRRHFVLVLTKLLTEPRGTQLEVKLVYNARRANFFLVVFWILWFALFAINKRVLVSVTKAAGISAPRCRADLNKEISSNPSCSCRQT